MTYMDHETAIRLASTVIDSVTPGQFDKMLGEYLRQRSLCVACGGVGKVTLAKSLSTGVNYDDRVDAGTEISCPTCFGETGGHDPAVVRWICVEPHKHCNALSENEDHQDCGFALCLTVPEKN